MIVDGSCPVLSFDIFDTILWRRAPRPVDVFGMLAARLRAEGHCREWITDAAFRRMRMVAEDAARRRRGSLGSEVSLSDIWELMPAHLFNGASTEQLVAAEVEMERAVTVVDLDVAEVLSLAQKHGLRTVFVSDTYFTENQLSYLLDRPELGSLQDVRVFRSHSYGFGKGNGLWPIVLSELGCRPEEIIHVGDNLHADIEAPGDLGIRTVHYERVSPAFEPVLEREHESLEAWGPFGALVDPEEGDFGITSLRAKTVQLAPSGTSPGSEAAWQYGAGVLGPVLTGFAEWVAERAHDAGHPIVWCPMREGTVLAELVNNAAAARGWNVQARPIWLSRHVVSVASLDSGDREALHDFIGGRYQLTVAQLLQTLQLRPGEVPSVADILHTVLDNETIVTAVRDALLETPHLRNRLAVTVTRAREQLLSYLRGEGALDAPDLPLVDLGWGGTIQFYLDRVLKIAGSEIRPSGYYMATDERSTRVSLAGLHMEGYIGQAGHPLDVVATLVRSPEVLEQCVNDLCGSLLGFSPTGEPVLGPQADTPSQMVERRAAQRGIFAFQQQWNRYIEASEYWPKLTGTARHRLAAIVVSALKAPTTVEAALFGNWAHEDNFGSTVITHVLPEDLVPAIPYLSASDLLDLNMRDAFWPSLIAASDARLGAATRAIASGHVDPSMFDPTDFPSVTSLRVQTSDGRWHDGPSRRVRINHNGQSFARMDFAPPSGDVTTISVAIPGRPAVVRLDWIELKAIRVGESVPETIRWEQPEDFSGLIHAGCTWLGGSMLEFEFDDAAIWLPVANRQGSPVSSGQVSVAFAMLPRTRTGLAEPLPAASRLVRAASRMREEYRMRGSAGLASAAARVTTRKLRSDS